MLDELKQEIHKLGWKRGTFKPHKQIALLATFEVLSGNGFVSPNVYFSTAFKDEFSRIFNKYFKDTENRCRPHTPFFHLQSASFWKLIPKEGMTQELNNTVTVGGPGALNAIVEYAEISENLLGTLRDEGQRQKLISFIAKCLTNDIKPIGHNTGSFDRVSPLPDIIPLQNPFVGYLNSLQRIGGSNENALAESQACNEYFSTIHVAHPLSTIIFDELNTSNGHHIILTGHAGDGKSTLALEVFKRFSRIPSENRLETPMDDREDIGNISIIKDLSERNKNEDQHLLDELVEKQQHFLLVTNTGTLLDLIKKHPDHFDGNDVTLESKVIKAISATSGKGILDFGSVKFRVFNLALMDNLNLAQQIFDKMLAPERWEVCQGKTCQKGCPVYSNVDLIQQNQKLIVDRLFLAYRRMYEYGTRLTIRQFTEHLAYMITSGLEYTDIQQMHQKKLQPLLVEHLFFNRFFGDNGSTIDSASQQMKAIKEVVAQGFGERPSSNWEHRLWLQSSIEPLELGVDGYDDEFLKLRKHGAKETSCFGMSSDQAREQVRRMLYFLYDFEDQEKEYLGQYLNSPTLLHWQEWQHPDAQLNPAEKAMLVKKIYHVLQEHLTGVRLPEGSTQQDRRLYVTLSRRSSAVRQSAQVVLAEVDWRTAIELKLTGFKSASGEIRYDLILCGKDRIKGIDLMLKTPFLDYVMMRHFGELGEVLQASYLERLERFKAEVQKRAAGSGDDGLTLVRLKTDHTFRRQHYAVDNGKLEVNDAL